MLPTAPELPRNRDSDFPYRHDSYFHYLTGFNEPGAWLVIDRPGGHSTLFCRAQGHGARDLGRHPPGPQGRAGRARRGRGFQPSTRWTRRCPSCWPTRTPCGSRLPPTGAWKRRSTAGSNKVRARVRLGAAMPAKPARPVQAARRDAPGQGRARASPSCAAPAQISAGAHVRAMQTSAAHAARGVKGGLREYHLEAELLHEFRRHGSQFPAYTSIVAAGANACVLHYRAGNAELQARRAVPDRRRLRARRLRQRHHPHLSGRRPIHAGPARAVRHRAGGAASRGEGHPPRQALHRPARRRHARAGAGHARHRPADQEPRHGKVDDVLDIGRLPPVLHAPHRPLDGHGRARLRRLHRAAAAARARKKTPRARP